MTEVLRYRWSSERPEDRFTIEDPATGEVVATLQGGGPEQVDGAVRAAQKAFQKWRWSNPRERVAMFRQISQKLAQHADEIIELETLENGKSLAQSRVDVLGAVGAVDYLANLIGLQPGHCFDGGLVYGLELIEPHGVVAAIIPFNWPPIHAAVKAASALALGNSVVVKPPEQDARCVIRVMEIMQEVLPEDVLQVIPGLGATGGALASHPLVSMITFTGSPVTGKAIMRAAAENHTPTVLELGGKNAMIVLEDADMTPTIKSLIEAAFMNSGEACTAGSRILVHRSRHDELVERLGAAVSKLKVGQGKQPGVHVGPMITKKHQERVLGYLRIGQDEGAKIAAQGQVPKDREFAKGFWVAPTVLDGVTRNMRVAREEIFGPVTCVMTFNDVDEAISIANDTEYGLTAAIFTQNHPLALEIARHLDVGMVFINQYFRGGLFAMPFGGVKASGYGRELSAESLKEFGRVKLITTVNGRGEIPRWPAVNELGI